jgi:hypothetical protein
VIPATADNSPVSLRRTVRDHCTEKSDMVVNLRLRLPNTYACQTKRSEALRQIS